MSKRSSTPKTTQSKKAKAVAEALEAFESVTATCVFGSRPARGETYIKFGWTVGQSGEHQGKQGKNLIMEFTLIEREWEGIEKTVFDRIAGHTGHWFSKAKKINFCKVKTPEVANMILLLLKEKCPKSSAGWPLELKAPEGYMSPVMKVIKVPELEVVGKPKLEYPMLFLVSEKGDTFTIKEALKTNFDADYGDIEFGGKVKPAWFMPVNEISDDAEKGLVAWLKKHGFETTLIDLCD